MALPNDVSRVTDELAKTAGSVPGYTGSKKKAARSLARQTKLLLKTAADAMASTTTAHTATFGFRAPCDGYLLGAHANSCGALTADNANNASLTVAKSDGAGGAATAMATLLTNVASGNWVAGGTKAFTPSATAADRRFTKGQLISFAIAKNGTGVVVPICDVQVDFEAEGPYDYDVA
jgi:hypothetical protein